MRIAVDMDAILVDLMPTWLRIYNERHNDNVTVDDVKSWDIHKYCKAGNAIYTVLSEQYLFRDLPAIPGAIEGVTKLVEAGHNVVIATAPVNAENMVCKVLWVQDRFKHLKFNHKNMMLGHQKNWLNADFLIDDGPHNLESFQGGTITIDYPWNREVDVNFRAHGHKDFEAAWKSIVDFITNR